MMMIIILISKQIQFVGLFSFFFNGLISFFIIFVVVVVVVFLK